MHLLKSLYNSKRFYYKREISEKYISSLTNKPKLSSMNDDVNKKKTNRFWKKKKNYDDDDERKLNPI